MIPINITLAHSRIFKLREPLDPQIVRLLKPEYGNFSHLSFWTERNGFGDVHQFLYVDKDYLLSIQPHNVDPKVEYNWLVGDIYDDGSPSRPYWFRESDFVFGDTLPAGNRIRLYTHPDGKPIITYFDNVSFPALSSMRDNVPMVQVCGFKPSMRGKPVQWLRDNGYIAEWTSVTKDGKIEKPYGLLNPVWEGWRANTNGARYAPLWYFEGYGD